MQNRRTSQGALWTRALLAAAFVLGASACNKQNFGVQSQSQEFGQKVTYNKDIDVLWVIDTSGSMAKHQSLLAQQVGLFVDALNSTGLNYQIGVTTMDMGNGGAKGRLLAHNGPAVLNRSVPNMTSILADRLQAGEQGSPVERGSEAMKAALENSQGLLRKDSLLVVIFLSNENDESPGVDYAGFLDSIRPTLPSGERGWIAHFMGVVESDPSCKTSEWGYSSPGERYSELARLSGGLSESICDADFRRALTNVKARVIEIATEFPLSGKPNEQSIKVYVNGIEVPNDEENGWTYRSETNAIRFHGSAVPAVGSTIKVDFDPVGLE